MQALTLALLVWLLVCLQQTPSVLTNEKPRRFAAAVKKKAGRVIVKSEAREADIEAERLAKLGWDGGDSL